MCFSSPERPLGGEKGPRAPGGRMGWDEKSHFFFGAGALATALGATCCTTFAATGGFFTTAGADFFTAGLGAILGMTLGTSLGNTAILVFTSKEHDGSTDFLHPFHQGALKAFPPAPSERDGTRQSIPENQHHSGVCINVHLVAVANGFRRNARSHHARPMELAGND